MDSVLAQATAQYNRDRMEALKREVVIEKPVIESKVDDESKPKRERKLPEPPPGWGSDVEASRSNMMAAKMLQRGGR